MQWKYDLFTKLSQLSRLKAPKTDYQNFMPPLDQVLQGGMYLRRDSRVPRVVLLLFKTECLGAFKLIHACPLFDTMPIGNVIFRHHFHNAHARNPILSYGNFYLRRIFNTFSDVAF